MPSNACQFVKQNNDRCKRFTALSEKFCWQHSHGLRTRWRALTRSQTVGFCLSAASLVVGLLFGVYSLLPRAVKTPSIHVESSGDQSPNVVDNKGKVEIQNQQSTTQEQKPKPPA